MRILLRGPGGEQDLVADAFPYAVFPAGRVSPLNQAPEAAAAPCFLGLAEDHPFIQPGGSAGDVRLNGRPLRESQWLHDGDTLRCEDTTLRCLREPGLLVLEVGVEKVEGDTLPPVEVTPPRTPTDPSRIEPVAFQPTPVQPRTVRRIHPASVFLILVFGLLGAAVWYLLSARSVEILITPSPEHMAVEDSLNLALAGRYLLRTGRYTVVAEKAGYHPLRETLEVGKAARQNFSFQLEKLPGLLVLSTGGVEGVKVEVDGTELGTTPLSPIELPAGPHTLHLSADRYLDHESELEIEGMGIAQELAVELTPRWAEVSVSSDPNGAILWVDGTQIGPVPRTAELLEGEHELEMRAPRRQTWSRRIRVAANTPIRIPRVSLAPAIAQLRLETRPGGANVTVDGKYAGQTPLDLSLKPDEAHRIRLTRAGYEPATRNITLEAGEQRPLTLTLSERRGDVRFESQPPGAQVWVDGTPRGTTPVTLDLLAVSHRIEFKRPGYAPYQTRVTPRPGFSEVLTAPLKSAARARASSGPATIKTRDGQVLRLIPPGRFTMGASRREQGRRSNETLRSVRLSHPFYLGVREVTNGAFRRFRPDHDSGSYKGLSLNGADRPVVKVSWDDAARYCNWLSEQQGLPTVYAQRGGTLEARRPLPNGYRLPTEAEWAWAARFVGGKAALRYPWGKGYPPRTKAGNYADTSAAHLIDGALPNYQDGFAVTAPAGSFPSNALGLYDLGGNVAEWTNDHYAVYPGGEAKAVTDPLGPPKGRHHVIRGASWRMAGISDLRLARRDYGAKGRLDLGFRIARNGASPTQTRTSNP